MNVHPARYEVTHTSHGLTCSTCYGAATVALAKMGALPHLDIYTFTIHSIHAATVKREQEQ